MPEPILSVITVCRNAEATIAATLDSVAAAKSSDIEYIVIDGASTDSTLSLVKSRKDLVDRWISEPDTGIFNAMNKGAALATGSYICYLNADDAYLPGALEQLLQQIQIHQNAGLLYGDWIGVDRNGKSIERRSKAELGWHYQLCHQAMAVRRNVLGAQPFDEQYRVCADFDAILKWLDSTSSVKVPFPMVRFSEAGVSNTNVGRAVKEGIAIAIRRRGIVKTWRFCLTTGLYWLKFNLNSFLAFRR